MLKGERATYNGRRGIFHYCSTSLWYLEGKGEAEAVRVVVVVFVPRTDSTKVNYPGLFLPARVKLLLVFCVWC